jgi:hypothetical protein
MTRVAGRHFTTAELDALRRGPALRASLTNTKGDE